MPKRTRKPHGANNVKRWSVEEQCHLLAWLDHCVRYAIRFDTTVATYMRSKTRRSLTQKKCTDKVTALWDNHGLEGSKSVWLEGSSSIGLREGEKQQIQQICDRLEASSRRSRLRSSSSRPSEYESLPHSRKRSETSPLTSLRSTPSTSSGLDPGPGLGGHKKPTNSETLFPSPKSRPSPSNPPNIASKTPDTVASRTELKADLDIRDGTSNGSSCTALRRSIGVQYPEQLPDSHHPTILSAKEIEKQTQLVAEKEAKIKAQQYQIFHLENDLSATRKEYDKLLRRLDDRNDLLHNPKTLYGLEKDNSALKKLLEDIRAAKSNELHIQANTLGPTTSAIGDDLDCLQDRIGKFCSIFRCPPSSTAKPLSETSVRLRELVARVSGMSIQQFNVHVISTGISGAQLFRSLVGALVCELAFELSFPDSLDVESLLLHVYREQVLIQGHRLTLESLDLLAHKSLFSNTYFVSKLVPEKARELAFEVFQLLVQWNYHGTQNQYRGPAAKVPKEELLQPIFTRALIMKGQLLLSRSYYTLVFPSPGTSFNPATMRRHDWKSDRYSQRSESPVQPKKEEELVKLCLFPALYAYRKHTDERLLHPQKVEKHVVNYCNFVDDDRSMAEEYVVVSKAIVQL